MDQHLVSLAFFNIGPAELILIFAIALVVFGPKRLPELGKSIGKSIRNFKKGLNEIDADAEEVDVTDEHKSLDDNSDAPKTKAQQKEPSKNQKS